MSHFSKGTDKVCQDLMKIKLIQLLAIKVNAINKIKFNKKKNFRFYNPISKMESFKQLFDDSDDIFRDSKLIAIYTINQNDYFR